MIFFARKRDFMSTRKLNQTGPGESKPALTRLKELPLETRLQVMDLLETHTYKDARPLVAQLAGIECTVNVLFNFRQWCQTEQELEHDTDLLEQVEVYLKKRKGNWSPERIQKSALGFLMMRSLSKGDPRGFSSIARLWMRREQLELREKKHVLDELKFEDYHQRKFDMALDALGREFDKNPEARRLYNQARNLIQGESDGK